jgi:hypothetical protein
VKIPAFLQGLSRKVDMNKLIVFLTENELSITVVSTIITFFLGRYTCRCDDRRQGRKDIDETFYKPFISLYTNAHHAYAYYFVDLPLETQDEIMKILLENRKRVAPWIERIILDMDQCYSGCRKQMKEHEEISDEDKKYVEGIFGAIFEYAEKQYARNERKLYHSLPERIVYKISEWKNQ